MTVVIIIARRIPWQATPSARLRWDALTETREVLATATEHPFTDGAFALAEQGLHPETPVTMRHEDAAHDSFKPMPLRVPAAMGARRGEKNARMTPSQRAASPYSRKSDLAGTEGAAERDGLPASADMPQRRAAR